MTIGRGKASISPDGIAEAVGKRPYVPILSGLPSFLVTAAYSYVRLIARDFVPLRTAAWTFSILKPRGSLALFGNIFPGFKIPRGSKASFSRAMSSRDAGEISSPM